MASSCAQPNARQLRPGAPRPGSGLGSRRAADDAGECREGSRQMMKDAQMQHRDRWRLSRAFTTIYHWLYRMALPRRPGRYRQGKADREPADRRGFREPLAGKVPARSLPASRTKRHHERVPGRQAASALGESGGDGPHSSRQLSSGRAPRLGARVGSAADNRTPPPRRGRRRPVCWLPRSWPTRRWLRCRRRSWSGLRPPARWSG
jgi:hypothetical protein